MIQGISQGSSAAADFARSVDALSELLKGANDRAMGLAEKMLKLGVQQTIQDASVGLRVDTSA
jgi:hypothetical protein